MYRKLILLVCLTVSAILPVTADTVANPQFSPGQGNYTTPFTVTISCSTDSATIYYTTDSSSPNQTSLPYMGPISIVQNTNLKAKAFRAGWTPSQEVTAVYTLTVATPHISPVTGTYLSITGQTVSISCPTPGAEIRYTTNGSDPTPSSALYSAPFTITQSSTVKARAYLTGWTQSAITTSVITLKAHPPSFNPTAGTYTSAQSIALSCATTGVVIRYTTDGSEPSAASTQYTAPISLPLDTSIVLNAKAFKTNWTSSDTSTASYLITGTVATPVISPSGGTYIEQSGKVITINCATSNANIRYTLDGSDPTISSQLYTGAFLVQETTTIKARAYRTDWLPSGIANSAITLKAYTPQVNIAPDAYNGIQTISLSCPTAGTTIRYTSNDNDPDQNSPIYQGPISILQSTTLKARAFRTGWETSDLGIFHYNLIVAMPIVSIPGGTYSESQTVAISTTTESASIFYTLDGSDPSSTSFLYNTPVYVNQNTILKCRAFKQGWTRSELATAQYELVVHPPVTSVAGGTYNLPQTVAISCPTPGASFLFSTDASEPGNAYTSPIPINQTTLLRTRAVKTGWTASEVVSAHYELAVVPPVIDIASGTYNQPQAVILTNSTVGANILYSTDSSEPDSIYISPIPVNQSTTLRAKAVKPGWTDSQEISAHYELGLDLPQASPAPGTYSSDVTISLASTYPQPYTIRYTTDGSDPGYNSATYVNPVNISQTTLLKARVYKSGWTESQVFSGLYLITGQVSVLSPVFNPAPGIYTSAQTISLNNNTYPTGAILRYTLDGTEPTISSPAYAESISLALQSEITIKVKAFLASWAPSVTYTGIYRITGQVQLTDVGFSPSPGTYDYSVSVALNPIGMTPGAELRYTTDGSNPDMASLLYSGPIVMPLNSLSTIKARAFKQDWEPSRIVEASYHTTGIVNLLSPSMVPPGDTYIGGLYVSLIGTTEPADATIRYTKDGSDPSISSEVYNGPIFLEPDGEYTLKFKAFKDNWQSSPGYSFHYRTVTYPTQVNLNASFSFDGTARKNYRLVGLPGMLNIPVELYMQGDYGYDWKLFREPGNGSLIPWSAAANFAFTPGSGYWMLSKQPVSISLPVASVPLDGQLGYTIPVHAGWNIISNPFNKNIPWTAVQEANQIAGAGIPDSLYSFDNGVWNETGHFEPQKAYYFWNRFPEFAQLRIPFAWPESGGLRANTPACRIELIGPEVNDMIKVGILPTALDSLDRLDQFAPPGCFSDYRLVLGDGTFRQEFRQSHDQVFEFQVDAQDWRDLRLRITPQDNSPNVYLWDKTDDSLVPITEVAQYPLAPLHNNFALVYGSSAFINDLRQSLTPQAITVFSNRPNPFHSITSIKASFSEPVRVTAEVFNLRGQRVALLENKEVSQAGSVAWAFDSSKLASGIYFCRVSWKTECSSSSKIIRMTCIK